MAIGPALVSTRTGPSLGKERESRRGTSHQNRFRNPFSALAFPAGGYARLPLKCEATEQCRINSGPPPSCLQIENRNHLDSCYLFLVRFHNTLGAASKEECYEEVICSFGHRCCFFGGTILLADLERNGIDCDRGLW